MKKHLLLLMALPLIFLACKRGPDDPSISLASRNSRLIGTWTLSAVDYTMTQIDSTTTTSTVTYNGTNLINTDTPGGTSMETFALTMVIAKNGALHVSKTKNGDIKEEDYSWEWINDDQQKSQLLLTSTSMVGGTWWVNRLSSKELILELNNAHSSTIGGVTTSTTEVGTLSFVGE